MYDEPKYSPWGSVQDCTTMLDGVFSVGTSGHGGILVKNEIVDDILSADAKKIGFVESSFLCFEEDCDAVVVMRELIDKKLWEIPSWIKDKDAFDESLNTSLQRYFPEYWEVYTANNSAHENGDTTISNQKRYIVHDFLIGSPILIDRQEKAIFHYSQNMQGQLYNLNNPEILKVSNKTVSGLIRRTNDSNYHTLKSKVVDGYIYKYLMKPELQKLCRYKPSISSSEKIIETDDHKAAITAMCEKAYEQGYCGSKETKQADKTKNLEYCDKFLNETNSTITKVEQKQSIHSRLQEMDKDVKPTILLGEKKKISKGVEI